MLKVSLNKTSHTPITKLDVYSGVNRIPFSVLIGDYPRLPTTIYARNLSGENFIEFRFDMHNLNLYDVTMVSIQNDTILNLTEEIAVDAPEDYFVCKLNNESKLEDSRPLKIYRGKTSICIRIVNEIDEDIKYYRVGTECFIGIDSKHYLKSIVLINLKEEDCFSIFGF